MIKSIFTRVIVGGAEATDDAMRVRAAVTSPVDAAFATDCSGEAAGATTRSIMVRVVSFAML